MWLFNCFQWQIIVDWVLHDDEVDYLVVEDIVFKYDLSQYAFGVVLFLRFSTVFQDCFLLLDTTATC